MMAYFMSKKERARIRRVKLCTWQQVIDALDHIDALEGLVEAAFREGYSAGNSAGNIGMIQEGADKTACWNISRAKAALAQAEEKGNG